ncbi:M15 family metallopeptidase [Neobacillus niacini]|uniref:M15 family metallopeptidase n=1 Tax=Neobacillus niacini TaxID=86668 RepID=UPI000AB2328F|nr:M15 family metallopeptidase [Neobacillus niacini]MEC1525861.1 M15 family metallopeptidase [Neobacillus niacini]
MKNCSSIFVSLVIMTLLIAGCSEKILNAKGNLYQSEDTSEEQLDTNKNEANPTDEKQKDAEHKDQSGENNESSKLLEQDVLTPPADMTRDGIQVVFNPESIPVLVNKQNKLPDNYNPTDLVYTDIPFVTGVTNEKRKMRRVAAEAVNQLFADAKAEGISLLGVSAYRSHATQTTLFNYYVNRDGYEKARTYSALPGTSEHETGLSIDVTGKNGKCAAENCFGGTKEAIWLEQNAAEYGFIIRYPKGKESITGYQYEPWHLRFVGKELALEITSKGITLEEFYNEV